MIRSIWGIGFPLVFLLLFFISISPISAAEPQISTAEPQVATQPEQTLSFEEMAKASLQKTAGQENTQEKEDEKSQPGMSGKDFSANLNRFREFFIALRDADPQLHQKLVAHLESITVSELPMPETGVASPSAASHSIKPLSLDQVVRIEGNNIYISLQTLEAKKSSDESRSWTFLYAVVLGFIPSDDPKREYKAMRFVMDLDYYFRRLPKGDLRIEKTFMAQIKNNLLIRKNSEDLLFIRASFVSLYQRILHEENISKTKSPRAIEDLQAMLKNLDMKLQASLNDDLQRLMGEHPTRITEKESRVLSGFKSEIHWLFRHLQTQEITSEEFEAKIRALRMFFEVLLSEPEGRYLPVRS